MDTYYCDENHLSSAICGGWREKNLDSTTNPMQYMHVQVEEQASGTLKGTSYTGTDGSYSISWEAASCSGTSFKVRHLFKRYRENGFPSTGRFRIVMADGSTTWSTVTTQYTFGTSPCGTNSCPVNKSFFRGPTPSNRDRLATVYYTVDSALREIITWSANLDAQFWSTSEATNGTGMLRVQYDNTTPESDQFTVDWRITLGYSKYSWGANTRHEIGHAVHRGVHNRAQEWQTDPDVDCASYNFNNEGNHGETTCEYAYAATQEGLATFFAVRSIVFGPGADKDAWFCFCAKADNTFQDLCSDTATPVPDANGDRNADCVNEDVSNIDGRGFHGVGDTFAEELTHCTRLTQTGTNGCNCTDADSDDICDGTWYQTRGWRNETQVHRFLWDVIDTNNDSGANEDTDESIYSFVSGLEGMTCVARSGFNTDGTCNEPNRASGGTCNPSDGTIPGSFTTGNRDSYNVLDFCDDSIIPGSQLDERVLNCVVGNID